jgi:hypothetical protein
MEKIVIWNIFYAAHIKHLVWVSSVLIDIL